MTRSNMILGAMVLSTAIATHAQNDRLGYIRTVAGNGDPSTISPSAVAVDRAGNLYIAESDNNRVTVLPQGGTLQPFAGNVNPGDSGDEGPAPAAMLIGPSGVAVDKSGNVYIADTGNHNVRVVTPDGIIHHFAGSDSPGFSGDGGPAATASLFFPSGLAVDGFGNVYIADSINMRVRKVTPDGTITTIAGSGDTTSSGDEGPATGAGVPFPSAVAVDGAGNVYVAETSDHVVRKITPDGVIHAEAGVLDQADVTGDNGPATQANLWAPSGLAVDFNGDLYIADTNNQRVQKVTPNGIMHTVAGVTAVQLYPPGFSGDGGPATRAELNYPAGLAMSLDGGLYIADYGNTRVRRVQATLTRAIQFSGYDWTVKSSQGKVGPGPNYFSDSADNAWVDDQGELHLKITNDGTGWSCAEVQLTQSLGYGLYRFYLDSPVDNLDPNVVFGLFTYDSNPAEHHRELDIEFSRWAKPLNRNAQYVIQPGAIPQNLARFEMPPFVPQSTHGFDWEPGMAGFLSIPGYFNPVVTGLPPIATHTFASGIPTPGAETLRFNLWLYKGVPPTNNAPAEVVIHKFEYIPR